MTLDEKIAQVVSKMQTPIPAFRYGRKQDENINGDNAAYPAIVLLEPDQPGFRISPSNGQIFERNNVFIQFLDITPTGMGEQANNRKSTINAMKLKAAEFLLRLNDSNLFSAFAEVVPGVAIIEYYDANVCGIEINIAGLTDTQPLPIC